MGEAHTIYPIKTERTLQGHQIEIQQAPQGEKKGGAPQPDECTTPEPRGGSMPIDVSWGVQSHSLSSLCSGWVAHCTILGSAKPQSLKSLQWVGCPLYHPGECKATVSQVSTVGGLPTVPSCGVQSHSLSSLYSGCIHGGLCPVQRSLACSVVLELPVSDLFSGAFHGGLCPVQQSLACSAVLELPVSDLFSGAFHGGACQGGPSLPSRALADGPSWVSWAVACGALLASWAVAGGGLLASDDGASLLGSDSGGGLLASDSGGDLLASDDGAGLLASDSGAGLRAVTLAVASWPVTMGLPSWAVTLAVASWPVMMGLASWPVTMGLASWPVTMGLASWAVTLAVASWPVMMGLEVASWAAGMMAVFSVVLILPDFGDFFWPFPTLGGVDTPPGTLVSGFAGWSLPPLTPGTVQLLVLHGGTGCALAPCHTGWPAHHTGTGSWRGFGSGGRGGGCGRCNFVDLGAGAWAGGCREVDGCWVGVCLRLCIFGGGVTDTLGEDTGDLEMAVGVVSARERGVVVGVLVRDVVAVVVVHAGVSVDETGREEGDEEEGDTVEAVDVGVSVCV
ncbi:hypothetical protein NDU88_006527 [Pleurodeles waltl]|uniref:Uncharacterized protein n=1 Tax=Pleurodeles waltl TaxID=8319 RepID=A0AAV7WER8_PLEWA|nr:hypothetical protein NDU88_006527 [Pleurodeles waltl]